eukprot:CAMPEP_0178524064 /NCGR_PEP_ID=MMETSP0696-20121128/29437_1 /TAXON_ID=265572 /ORGANISM="Extubocellulus spinifer, Strain CCMP396" /LENGTH=592 /DNA_ID=CAMNT_0020155361 /DNA_START=84 /DNA_END=1862 /DNA_ORIENTATION=-
MASFPSFAALVASLLLSSSLVAVGGAASVRTGDAEGRNRQRNLSTTKFLDYKFDKDMTDHARIDRDQLAIQQALALQTSESFDNAKTIYEEGGHSKSYARLKLVADGGLPTKVKKGSAIKGKTADGVTIHGKAYEQAEEGDAVIEVQYPTDEGAAPCFVGALNLVDNEVTDGCFAKTGKITIGKTKLQYDYNVEEENLNGRTIAGFSLGAKKKMYDTEHGCAGCPYPEYAAFYDYYQDFEYADDWVKSAASGSATPFSGNGNADFSKFGFIGRGEAVKKGAAYMNTFMYVIRELRDAIDDCNVACSLECNADDTTCTQCNDEPVAAWDEAVAFYTGSLAETEGHDGGYLLYSLANKRGLNCGTHTDGQSWVNTDIFENFHQGKKHLEVRNCKGAEKNAERISQLMNVPLIQGTLRYAHKLSEHGNVERDSADLIEKHNAEGATFAAAVLPALHKCNEKAAKTVYKNMKVGKLKANYPEVKQAFESTYDCLGISCADVGGVLNDISQFFLPEAAPCGSQQPFKQYTSAGGGGTLSAGAKFGIAFGSLAAVGIIAGVVAKRMNGRKEEVKDVPAPAESAVESYTAEDTGEKSII